MRQLFGENNILLKKQAFFQAEIHTYPFNLQHKQLAPSGYSFFSVATV